MKRLFSVLAIIAFASLVTAAPLPKEDEKLDTEKAFMKVTKDKGGIPLTLETATVRYKDKNEATIDLIGAIHIADKVYYQQLNKQFKDYDVVLYELVAPKGTAPKRGGEGMDIYSMVGLFLDLDSQVKRIDYKAKNFVHADLSPEELSKAIQDRGHDSFTLALTVILDMVKQSKLQGKKPKIDLGKLEHEDQTIFLKRVLALNMEQSEDGLGATLQSILVDDRNKAAMKVLETQLKNGKKKIGIFYGAAHMPDFDKRLRDMGFGRVSTTWQKAWDIDPQ